MTELTEPIPPSEDDIVQEDSTTPPNITPRPATETTTDDNFDNIEEVGLDDDEPNTNPPAPMIHTHVGEHRGDHGDISIPISKSVYLFAACAALNSANLGYDIGVNTDAAKLVQQDMGINDVQLEIFMGSLNLFAMIGALFANVISDTYGRRKSFIVAAVGFIVGILIMATAEVYSVLMIGRVFVGLGLGFGLAIDPLYISEISPASHRGQLVTWSEIAINIGIVLGFSSGLIFYNIPVGKAWRCMFGMGVILPVIVIFLATFVMPESPRWLVQKGREVEAAKILERIYPPGFDVEAVVRDIRVSIEKETEAEHAAGWDVILFPTPAFRRMLFIGISVAIAQQAVGIDAIQYFLVFIIDETGIKTRGAQGTVLIFLGLLKLVFVLISGPLFDKIGRRILFFVSLGGMTIALLMLSVDFLAPQHNAGFAVFALALYLSFFSIGMGPGAWLIPSEVFSTTIRAKAMSIATFMNRVTATLMASTFLSVAKALTWAGFFLILACICIVVAVFLWLFLPETKGRALEDMSVYFAEITGDRSILDLEERVSRRVVQSMESASSIQNKEGEVEISASGTMA